MEDLLRVTPSIKMNGEIHIFRNSCLSTHMAHCEVIIIIKYILG